MGTRRRSSAVRSVRIPASGTFLSGDLVLPADPVGVVVFAHGSGSGRHSPRNQQVAAALQGAGLGTLLMDLLTEEEDEVDAVTRHLRFDIPLLAGRLTDAVDWLDGAEGASGLPTATFGASSGAAAALITAADRPERVRAVISRGGRPDLAGDALERVLAPTLLIVGGADHHVLDLNRRAAGRLAGEHALAVGPRAGPRFEVRGAREQGLDRSHAWRTRWLPGSPAPDRTG